MPRSAVLIRVAVWSLLLVGMAAARPVVSRFVCVGCEREGQFSRLFQTRRAASTRVGKSSICRKLGLGVREISVVAGTAADVMAGGAGAAGPAPDVRHQPPGIYLQKKKDIPKHIRNYKDITPQKKQFFGYHGISL